MKKTLITLAAIAVAVAPVALAAQSMTTNDWGNYELGTNTYDATTYNGTGKVYCWGNSPTFEVAGENTSVTIATIQGYDSDEPGYGHTTITKTGTGTLVIAGQHEHTPYKMVASEGTLKLQVNAANNYEVGADGTLDLTALTTLGSSSLTLGNNATLALSSSGLTIDATKFTMGTGVTIDVSSWSDYDSFTPTTLITFSNGSLTAGQEFAVAIKTSTGTNSNAKFVVSADGKSMKLIPEPTTATLSLLALAGLAARRRRK